MTKVEQISASLIKLRERRNVLEKQITDTEKKLLEFVAKLPVKTKARPALKPKPLLKK